ncbi:DUF6268 family outer membrane beta-barrel protein [Winogradskyella immobilis]|uniref:DUF6268 domain-containing protein n=1 Tax=Winogradskyella immobilis TaxID=2816852 RepID=A0ABS8ELC5_9FLAO|nr:DUF6268 family outer membrane beta-barrel protein [Winogradskyella immobilis]MCC1483831.1 hypothetical protein [Winogradskyella immobilis]MCG0015925.1 DUF6268 family outer membrane beta-barrel protein [Winogradskyella immobilis]
MHKPITILSFLILFITTANAQLSDLARLDYTIIPENNSNIEYSKTRALFNIPVKLKREGEYLLLGLDYSTVNLNINRDNPTFDKDLIGDFQSLDLSLGYTKPLKNDWRLGIRVKPGFSTNLTANSLSFEDLVISADVVFIRERELENNKKDRLILGVTYSQNRGFLFPLPFVSYYKKFHEKWSYNIGIPKTNLQYHLSDKHRFKFSTELDGFTANLQNGIEIDGQNATARIFNVSTILGGIQYEYHIIDHLEFFAQAAYTFSNNIRLRTNNRDNLITINNESSLFLKTGLRLKI